MTQVNLLPWREIAKKNQKNKFIVMIILTIVMVVIAIAIIHSYYQNIVTLQEQNNSYLLSQIDVEQTQLNKLNLLYKDMLHIHSALNFILSLQQQNYQTIEFLDTLAEITPSAISLSRIEKVGNQITIIGKAQADSQISLFMENIARNKNFNLPELTQITTGDATQRLFQIKVTHK